MNDDPMNPAINHIDCQQAGLLLDRHLNSDLSAAEEQIFQTHLSDCPTCREEWRIAESVRNVMRQAVKSVETPSTLRDRVRGVTAQQGSAAHIIPVAGAAGRGRADRSWWRYAAVAAVAVMLIGSWFLFFADRSREPTIADNPTDTSQATPAVNMIETQLAEVLRIGVADHIRCGVTFHSSPDEQFTPEQIISGMGEYAGLVPVVRELLADYRVAVAHQCTIGGRKYVHLILRRDEEMVSLAITRKKPGESFPDAAAADTSASLPIYQARLDDYHSAGFETDDYLAFVVSDHSREQNMQLASLLASPVAELLQKMRA